MNLFSIFSLVLFMNLCHILFITELYTLYINIKRVWKIPVYGYGNWKNAILASHSFLLLFTSYEMNEILSLNKLSEKWQMQSRFCPKAVCLLSFLSCPNCHFARLVYTLLPDIYIPCYACTNAMRTFLHPLALHFFLKNILSMY